MKNGLVILASVKIPALSYSSTLLLITVVSGVTFIRGRSGSRVELGG